MTKQIVSWLLVGFLVLVIGLDIWFAVDKEPENTWSEIIRAWALKTPIFAWIWGVLAGHFFHPIDNLEPRMERPGNYAMLIWITCVVLIIGVGLQTLGAPVPVWLALVPAYVAGVLLWPV